MKVYYYQLSVSKQWYFRIVARNGHIVAQSEGYTSKRGCLKTISSIEFANFKVLPLPQ